MESSIGQWSQYDKKYDDLSQWLKDMEARVRNEANLKQDLPNKIEQFELLKVSCCLVVCLLRQFLKKIIEHRFR